MVSGTDDRRRRGYPRDLHRATVSFQKTQHPHPSKTPRNDRLEFKHYNHNGCEGPGTSIASQILRFGHRCVMNKGLKLSCA